jgi:hypothetical protein
VHALPFAYRSNVPDRVEGCCVDRLNPPRIADIRHNLVHRAVLEDHCCLAGFQAYVCGVPAMTKSARAAFIAAGLSDDDFISDAFVTRAEAAFACA